MTKWDTEIANIIRFQTIWQHYGNGIDFDKSSMN